MFAKSICVIAFASLALVSSVQAQQVGLTVQAISQFCPSTPGQLKCTAAIKEFVSVRKIGDSTDQYISELVIALADICQLPETTDKQCDDIVAAIRIAAQSLSIPAKQIEILDVASALETKDFQTADIQPASPN